MQLVQQNYAKGKAAMQDNEDDDYSEEEFENTAGQPARKKSSSIHDSDSSEEGGLGNMRDINELLSSPTDTAQGKVPPVESDNYSPPHSSDEEF